MNYWRKQRDLKHWLWIEYSTRHAIVVLKLLGFERPWRVKLKLGGETVIDHPDGEALLTNAKQEIDRLYTIKTTGDKWH